MNISCAQQVNNKNSLTLHEVNEDQLHIVMADSSFEKIVEIRDKAIKENLLRDKKQYVKALLICGDDTVKASIRLKGDHTDHLKGNRWSYRVKTKKEGKVLGESKFSVQGVHTRAFMNEWVFHELLKQEGLIGLQYEFIPVKVNEIDSLGGIYAFESHFKTEILTIQGKEIGPIMKFNEDDFWNYTIHADSENRDSILMVESEIIVTNKKGFKKELGIKSASLLKGYKLNLKLAEEVFDLKKWATFLTINGLMAGKHGLRWHNLRFYYNPTTELIEPIGFDSGTWQLQKGAWFLESSKMEAFYQGFYKSEIFKKYLQEETKRLSDRSVMKIFFDDRSEDFKSKVKLIQAEKQDYKFWPISFYNTQDSILSDYNRLLKK